MSNTKYKAEDFSEKFNPERVKKGDVFVDSAGFIYTPQIGSGAVLRLRVQHINDNTVDFFVRATLLSDLVLIQDTLSMLPVSHYVPQGKSIQALLDDALAHAFRK